MAARKSTASTARSGRKPKEVLPSMARAVDDERMRLMKLHSLLQCIVLALESVGPREPVGAAGPYFPDVVAIASDMALASIGRLESLHDRSRNT